jgi:hypothetical protein
MTVRTKITIILLCFFLCGAGTYLASTVHEKREPQKMNTIPVKNRDVVRRIWIVAGASMTAANMGKIMTTPNAFGAATASGL